MVKTILWGPLFLSPCKDQGTYKEEKNMLNNLTNPKEWAEAVEASRAFKARMGGYLQLSKFKFAEIYF